MAHRHTPRLSTFDYRGFHRYSLTFCAFHRRHAFVDPLVATSVLHHFMRAAKTRGFAILAYCFMPDHVHLLIEGLDGESDAVAFINAAKQTSGFWYRGYAGEFLWQRSAWDRVIRSDEQTMTVVRYLLLNPVRAGLVAHPLDYPFSGSAVYSREELMDAFRDWHPA